MFAFKISRYDSFYSVKTSYFTFLFFFKKNDFELKIYKVSDFEMKKDNAWEF